MQGVRRVCLCIVGTLEIRMLPWKKYLVRPQGLIVKTMGIDEIFRKRMRGKTKTMEITALIVKTKVLFLMKGQNKEEVTGNY